MKYKERFKVELQDNPSTGSGWQLEPNSAVTLISETTKSLAPPAAPGQGDYVGAPVLRVFEFEALKSTTLRFKLVRIGKEVLETKNVPVHVEGGNPLAAFALVALGGAGLYWVWKRYG